MRGWSALLLLCGCAQIFGLDETTRSVDASIDTATPADTTTCTGGDLAMADPVYGHCYTFFATRMPRDAGKAACEGTGAHLARISSMTENNFVLSLVGSTGIAYLGANDLGAEGTFLWDDGTLIEYSNWNLGAPDSGGGLYEEDCVVIDGTTGGRWDDRPCLDNTPMIAGTYAVVCERE
jgi:hypothetical protein